MDGIKDRGLSLSWKEIYRFRREFSCDPEEAVRALVQKHKYKSSKQPPPAFAPNEPYLTWRDLPAGEYQMATNGTWPSHPWQPHAVDMPDTKRHTAGAYRGAAGSAHSARHPDELVMGTADLLGNAVGDSGPYADAYGLPAGSWSGYCMAPGYDLPGASSRAGDVSYLRCGLAGERCYSMATESMPGAHHAVDCSSSSSSRDAIGHLSQEVKSLSLGSKLASLEVNGMHHEPSLAMASAAPALVLDGARDCLDAAAVVEASQRYLEAEQAASEKQIWSCGACTYLNAPEREVCEMCSKSKHLGPEMTPLLSGGKQCPLCTLVNDRQALSCSACSQSLKDSPTYI